MLISHEVPIELLEESKTFNDYDYCLLHLALKYPEYKEFYVNSVKEGRQVLLDNSLFELGDSLSLDVVAQGVVDIQPTWVVIPDCLNNKDVTIERFKEWESRYSNLNVKTIGVVQGHTFEELVECYRFMSEHADKIAIPFDSLGFSDFQPTASLLERWCEGRKSFVSRLIAEGIWNYQKPHHLLGCSLAREFSFSLYLDVIESIDTSNPVVAAINHLPYSTEGLNTKPPVKLCDLSEYILTEDEYNLMLYNIQMFKYICGVRKKWVAFFSQTGSEIANIIQRTGRYPFAIVTNNLNFQGDGFLNFSENVREAFQYSCIYFIDNPSVASCYEYILHDTLKLRRKDFITLHGYLRVIPASICNCYNIFNLHPGLITKYPELKGMNPQEKAFNLHLSTSGVVIHKAIPEVDSGEVLVEEEVSIQGLTLDGVYKILHDVATEAWIKFFREVVEENAC